MSDVTLTKAEEQAALDAALAQKVATAEAEEKAVSDAAAAEAEAKKAAAKAAAEAKDRKAHPLKWVGVELDAGDGTQAVVYYPNVSPINDRDITVNGLRHEHTREDVDGVWIYRHLDRR